MYKENSTDIELTLVMFKSVILISQGTNYFMSGGYSK